MAGNLKVFVGGLKAREKESNELVVAELEKWLARAKDRQVTAIAICAIASDGNVLTQFVPDAPDNAFTLAGGVHHLLRRVAELMET